MKTRICLKKATERRTAGIATRFGPHMFPLLENCTEALHLKLANGQEWLLVAAEPFRPWLQKFGRVMRLKAREINGLPKLIFTSPGSFLRQREPLREDLTDDTPNTNGSSKSPLAPPCQRGEWGDFRLPLKANSSKTVWKSRDLGAMRLWTHPLERDVVCEMEPDAFHGIDVLRMWFSVDIMHARAVSSGGLPLHAGLVAHNGRGLLLGGPGGVGKSTCCKRIPTPWRSLCDDETLVVVDAAGEYRGHPFPTWSDYLWGRPEKTWDVQDHLPINGIAFLKQAEKDHIQPVGRGEAAMLINSSSKQVISRHLRGLSQGESAAFTGQVFENACKLAQRVPVFVLSVAHNGAFWVEIERALDL
jgi:SynChlorMet cassette protein ScmC